MTQSHQEAPVDIHEQLALDDSQLALRGIARSMDLAQQAYDSAEFSLNWAQNYVPSAPAPDPGHDRGSLDHQDWVVESYRESDEEVQADLYYREEKTEEAYGVLSALKSDKKAIADGKEDAISKYAQQERERIQAEITKQEAAKAAVTAREKHLKGVEIEGATELSAVIKDLAADPNLSAAIGKKSSIGWKFLGTSRHGNRLMFERLPADAPEEPYHYSSMRIELLSIGIRDDGTEVQYSAATDIDQDAVKRYGTDIATIDNYEFNIKSGGNVVDEGHRHGTINNYLPSLMDNGVINAFLNNPTRPGYSADKITLEADDMIKLRGKIIEVTSAMQEVANR